MGLLDKFQGIFGGGKVDIDKRFELLREAISGTMSKFYMARDRRDDRIVGLKVGDREKVTLFEARFKGLKKPPEGEIAMALNGHPRIVETYEYGRTTNDLPYVVMEYLRGYGMQGLVHTRDPQIDGHRVSLIRQMAEALAYVHKKKYIHRDVCPRNFICTEDMESVKLIDFGLTLPAEKPYMQPGNRTGTPLYMAPEVVRRRSTDQRLDIFSFGVTAYHLCCYELPWPVSETSGLAALAHDTSAPKSILEWRPSLNKSLADAIMKCMEPNPDKRFQSMESFLQAIRGVEQDDE
ncbi:MAG: serine/threonine-protein kinase [Pirellulaceae bacterium]